MLRLSLAIAAVAVPVAAVAAGPTAARPAAPATVAAKLVPDVKIRAPKRNRPIRGATFLVGGDATPPDAVVHVKVNGKRFTVRARHGAWATRVKTPHARRVTVEATVGRAHARVVAPVA